MNEILSGIYCIKNTVTGKVYIGSAVNLRKRKKQHFSQLANGKHFNRYLQSAYDKYGIAAFASVETRAKQSASLTGRKMSPEAVRKSSEARTGKPRPDVAQWAPEKLSMFTREQVAQMRTDRESGATYRALADKYGCVLSTAYLVINRGGAFYAECA